MNPIFILAFVVSPAFADVYKCNSGNKTIYQNAPCPNAKLIDNTNGLAPSREEQIRVMERVAREKALVAQLKAAREAKGSTVTITTVVEKPVTPMPYRTDRYYNRADRYETRTVTTTRPIQNQ